MSVFYIFFNDTATTEIYTLSLHDALPILGRLRQSVRCAYGSVARLREMRPARQVDAVVDEDRKSTRLNSSHANISYAVFCLKKKKEITPATTYVTLIYLHTFVSYPLSPFS